LKWGDYRFQYYSKKDLNNEMVIRVDTLSRPSIFVNGHLRYRPKFFTLKKGKLFYENKKNIVLKKYNSSKSL
jgi:hypothetical protein